ncbi:MAG TPA: acyl-CoA dehydrogenase family protein [Bauldia sp.]|nr:acyl-CoA dehydrogenase family protein [Bauldia sp.]
MPAAEHLDWPFFEARHRDWQKRVARFADEELPRLVDHADVDATCRRLVRAMGAAGLLAPVAVIDAGARFDVRSLCIARETLAWHDGLADFAFAMQGLGTGPVSLFGTTEQRTRWLPPVIAGTRIAAFALTEPASGSDVASIATSAAPDGSDYRLNGEKTYISNGGIADHYVVFARTGEAPGARGLTAFMVEADAAGLSVLERIETSAPHPLARIAFSDVRVPAAGRIGRPGEGFKVAMATLDVFRATVGAAALGFARRALAETLRHVRTRKAQGGGVLADLQMTQAALADMVADVEAAALMVYRAAWKRDAGAERITREASLAKLVATEAAQRVVDQAVQLHGGAGIVRGARVEGLYREVRALRIYEGSTEIQKIVIARATLAAAEAE